MPSEADPVAFMLSGGRVIGKPAGDAEGPKAIRLGDLFNLYRADSPLHLENSTRKLQETHFRRLLEVFPGIDLQNFDKAAAQTYITRRAKQTYRGKPIQRDTIAKELKTVRDVTSDMTESNYLHAQ